MNSFLKSSRGWLVIPLFFIGFVALDLAIYSVSPFGGYHLLLEELGTGFWYFLSENIPAISWDAGTWGPGLVAFLLALLMIHLFLSKWAAAGNRYWSFGSSFCLALLLPVLFAISLLVPGVLLQWELLRQTHWIEASQ